MRDHKRFLYNKKYFYIDVIPLTKQKYYYVLYFKLYKRQTFTKPDIEYLS